MTKPRQFDDDPLASYILYGDPPNIESRLDKWVKESRYTRAVEIKRYSDGAITCTLCEFRPEPLPDISGFGRGRSVEYAVGDALKDFRLLAPRRPEHRQ